MNIPEDFARAYEADFPRKLRPLFPVGRVAAWELQGRGRTLHTFQEVMPQVCASILGEDYPSIAHLKKGLLRGEKKAERICARFECTQNQCVFFPAILYEALMRNPVQPHMEGPVHTIACAQAIMRHYHALKVECGMKREPAPDAGLTARVDGPLYYDIHQAMDLQRECTDAMGALRAAIDSLRETIMKKT